MIREYLKNMVKLQQAHKRNFKTSYISIYDFILKNGKECNPQPFNEELFPGTPNQKKECFRNAWVLSDLHDLIYVEGIANKIIPMMHAWCVDEDLNVYDPTWDDPQECTYFGVLFNPVYVAKTIFKRGLYGVIDNLEQKFPLITGKDTDFKYAK